MTNQQISEFLIYWNKGVEAARKEYEILAAKERSERERFEALTKYQLIARLAELREWQKMVVVDDDFQEQLSTPGSEQVRLLTINNVEVFKIKNRLRYKYGWIEPEYNNH